MCYFHLSIAYDKDIYYFSNNYKRNNLQGNWNLKQIPHSIPLIQNSLPLSYMLFVAQLQNTYTNNSRF